LLVKYLSDERAGEHITYTNENMCFHDADADDPDWMIHQCYILLITGASEMENGVDNLWKKGDTSGHRNHPDFGQYIGNNVFKAFKSAAHFCWANEEHWSTDHRDLTLDVFLPCLNKLNERRKNLLRSLLIILHESMSV
jgi:hypothetical protein